MDVIEMAEALEIARLEDWDATEALRLSTESGWNQTMEDWQRAMQLARRRGRFAGRVNGELVATGMLIEHGNKCGWVGMILVDARFRRRGYGTAMLDRTIAAADEAGLSWIGLDATDMGRPLYLKRGFHDVGHKDRWRLQAALQSHDASEIGELSQVEDWGLRDELCILDYEATGIDRTSMFGEFYIDPLVDCWLARRDGILVGFGLSRPGRIGSYIGPVIAQSVDVASGIVSKLMAQLAPGVDSPVFMDVPRGSSIESWLKSNGCEVVRSWTRMVRGEPWKSRPEMIFAIAGPELG